MRRMFLGFMFATCAIASALVWPIRDAYGEIAVCADGVCTMKESDYRQLQAFHSKTMDAIGDVNKNTEKMANDIEQLSGALNRCRSQLPQKPI